MTEQTLPQFSDAVIYDIVRDMKPYKRERFVDDIASDELDVDAYKKIDKILLRYMQHSQKD